ncbi:transposase [Aeromonas sp. R6-2]|uniref:transposase n=1 Tax=unclassified Aeromonas TaxID=257493 RepID=UPI0034A48D6B
MTQPKRRTFTPQFRLECAQLVLDQGYSFRSACDAMGVSKSALEYWVRQLRSERAGASTKGTPEGNWDTHHFDKDSGDTHHFDRGVALCWT